jgi:hypothetical protein
MLRGLLRAVCEDAVFLLASSQRLSEEDLEAMAKRRAERYVELQKAEQTKDWDSWVIDMCVALAPVNPPKWLPMDTLVESLTLEAGARGVRSLFTSKPSEKEMTRARNLGALAVRCLTSVLGADGELSSEDVLVQKCLASSLGLPENMRAMLLAERPIPIEAIEIQGELDSKVAKQIVRGAWLAAYRDGIAGQEEASILALAKRFGLELADTESLRQEMRTSIENRKSFGAASVDAIRYVLSDDDEVGQRLARTTALLALPMAYRSESLVSIEHGGPIILAKRYGLERADRETCLAISWFCALSTDPSETRTVELAARHDRVASDLGSKGEARAVRGLTREFAHSVLGGAVVAAGL